MSPKILFPASTYSPDLEISDARHRLKHRVVTVFHVLGLVTSLIAIFLFSAAIPRWNANFFHNSGPNRGDWTDGISIGPLTFAFIYHTGTVVYEQMKKRRGEAASISSLSTRALLIHAGVPLLVILSLFPCLFVAGYGSLFRFWQAPVRTQSGAIVCNLLNVFTRECEPVLYSIGSLQIAGITFSSVVWVLHFMLALVSLRDLRRQRLMKQLQKEKLAQYEAEAGNKRHSHRRGTGSGPRSGSSSMSNQMTAPTPAAA